MKRHLFIILCLLCALHLWANPVTVDQARQKAAAFFQDQQTSGARRRAPAARQLRLAAQGRDNSYYIFNAGQDGGFVIVSGDDATEEILGSSPSGQINPLDIPCNLQMLLDSYADQIKFLRDNGITRDQNRSTKKAPTKSFHLDENRLARYDQGTPFNKFCPLDGGTVTGCVATAMAQLMYYHKWPSYTTSEIPAYVTKTRGFEREAIPNNSVIDWTNIRQEYGGDYSAEEAYAVANLMKMAGSSVHMDYKYSENAISSSAYDVLIPFALKKYFGYEYADFYGAPSSTDDEVIYLPVFEEEQKPSLKWDDWLDMLRSELENNGPVIYGGTSRSNGGGGHSFLLEGYYEDGSFDVNFGWNVNSSNSNGRYFLNVVVGDFEYIYNQSAILNVKPQSVLAPINIPLKLTTVDLLPTEQYLYSRSQDSEQFTGVTLKTYLMNRTPIDTYFDYGFRFVPYSNTGSSKDIIIGENMRMMSMGKNGRDGEDVNDDFNEQKDGKEYSFSVGPDVEDGVYMIYCISKKSGTNEWLINDNDWWEGVIICNDKLALVSYEEDRTVLELIDLIQSDSSALRVGKPSEFTYMINNNNAIDYYGDCILVLAEWKEGDVYKEVPIAIDEKQIDGGKSLISSFTFTPIKAGNIDIVFYTKRWDEIGRYTVTVHAADESLDMLEMTNLTIDNLTPDGSIDGTYLKGGLTMHNSDEVTKQESIKVILLDVETGIIRVKPIQVNIAPDETVTYGFQFTNLIVGHHYRVIVNYQSGTEFYRSDPMLCKDEDTGETYEGNEDLAYYEYWFDKDYAKRKAVGIDGSKAVVRASIATDDLADGFHLLNFRVKNIDGEFPYSSVNTTPFLKLTKEQEDHLDYWIDDNRDGMKTLPLADTEDEQLLELDLSDDAFCSPGFHRLNIQVATKGSVMGSVQSQGVLKLAKGMAGELEYWFDNDVQHSQKLTGKRSSADDGYIYISQLDLSALTPGQHRLNFRAVSSTGLTAGSVLSCTVMKLSTGKATQLEYWFDDDTANRYFLDGTADGDCYVYDYMLDMSDLPFGLHRLNIRPTSTDGSNKGSLVTSNVLKVGTGSVKTLEYWFDGDIAHSRTLGVQSGEGADFVFADDLNLNGIAPGHHRLYCRAIGDDPTTTTAIVSYAVVVKLRYGADGDATMASYSLTLDNDSVVAYGQLSAKSEVVFNYTLDASELAEGTHTLKATFWNSFGASVTDVTPFWVRGALDGDVNADGQVGIGDIVAITNYMAGMANGVTLEQADVNGDGEVGIGDIVAITNIMAGIQ